MTLFCLDAWLISSVQEPETALRSLAIPQRAGTMHAELFRLHAEGYQ